MSVTKQVSAINSYT